MDALASLLDCPRAQGAFLLRTIFEPPWAVRIADRAPLSLVTVVSGHATHHDFRLEKGDAAILRGPDPYVVGDDPSTPIQAVIHPGQRCTTPDGRDLHEQMSLGVRSWGNNPYGSTILLVGTYTMAGAASQRLLSALPPALFVSHTDWDSRLIGLLDDEIVLDRPGQEVMLDRLLDLLLVAVLRGWFSRPGSVLRGLGWLSAQTDPIVGPALRLLHEDPARPWTVAGLAAQTGASRAFLARRFTELVGEPPMAYLTGWRLALAADLLREPAATIGSVARKVGYGSSFALSTAFKRVRGITPREHRSA